MVEDAYFQFNIYIGGYWSTIENQKRFFDKFAQERGLDPLNPNDWYHVNDSEVIEAVGFITFPLCCCLQKNYREVQVY